MSSYPVLNNRSIDQWKVTELKEELKRRKLITKGLKDDLIRRLDEALRIERENAEEEEAKEENHVDNGTESHPWNKSLAGNSETAVSGCVTESDQSDKNDEKVDDARVSIDINESLVLPDQSIPVDGTATVGGARTVEALTALETTVESSIEISTAETSTDDKGNTAMEIALTEQGEQHPENEGNGMSDNHLEDEDLKGQVESENIKMPPEKTVLASAAPNNQVSEVSSNLGFQVKSDSINNDPVSINEKNEFDDNIKLELDVVKPEMVEPSSSNVVPVGGESHPMDVKELHESKVAVEEKEDKNNSMNANMNRNNEITDLGDAEKLNLDQRSSDDSMEEDVLEGKNIDSKQNDCEGSNKEKTEATAVKEESPVDIIGDVDEKDTKAENSQQSTLAEKRKLNDGGVGNNEVFKRQRKWKAEGIKVPEPQGSNLVPTTTPRDTLQTPTSRRNFSRSDSTASDDVPKERVVPAPQKPLTNSLRIDQFLRPFTLKAVQELLGKTGTVKSFWMDHIKTHCYVTYSTVEEAVETRNAIYNLQWPPNGGRLLIAEFVEPEEVKARVEASPQGSAPVPATQSSQPPPRQQAAPPKQQLPPPPPFPPPAAQERDQGVPLPPPPPLPEMLDPTTIITLDVLFRKTKATPRIYYLPLSEEQAAAKLSARGKALRQK